MRAEGGNLKFESVVDCPECAGAGWLECGRGHYGDCNELVLDGWKPVMRTCGRCKGRGRVTVEAISTQTMKVGKL